MRIATSGVVLCASGPGCEGEHDINSEQFNRRGQTRLSQSSPSCVRLEVHGFDDFQDARAERRLVRRDGGPCPLASAAASVPCAMGRLTQIEGMRIAPIVVSPPAAA